MRVVRGTPFPRLGPCALTIGNFDGLHRGHQAMLAKLRAEAATRGLPVAVLTFEPHPRELFSPDNAPTRLTSMREKLELLRSAGVDYFYLCHFNRELASLTASDFTEQVLVQQLDCRYLLIGDDFRFGRQRQGSLASLQQDGARLGFSVAALPSVQLGGERSSSTAVREALASGQLQRAAELLGRPYSISGRVMHGDKIGRQLGFPTANVQLKHNRPPLFGIFVVELHGLERPYQGVASLGLRPTVTDAGRATLEVHLFDFDRDIYRQHVRIDFLHKLRDEEKYIDLPTLTAAIARDVEQARAWFTSRSQP